MKLPRLYLRKFWRSSWNHPAMIGWPQWWGKTISGWWCPGIGTLSCCTLLAIFLHWQAASENKFVSTFLSFSSPSHSCSPSATESLFVRRRCQHHRVLQRKRDNFTERQKKSIFQMSTFSGSHGKSSASADAWVALVRGHSKAFWCCHPSLQLWTQSWVVLKVNADTKWRLALCTDPYSWVNENWAFLAENYVILEYFLTRNM